MRGRFERGTDIANSILCESTGSGSAFPEFTSVEGKKMEYADPELAAGNASFHYRVR